MKLLKLISLLLCSFSLFGQYFEGQITYSVEYIPKNGRVNIDSIRESGYGSIKKYFIKDRHYKLTYYKESKETYTYIYQEASKRMYDIHADKNYILYRDTRNPNYNLHSSKIYKDSTKRILDFDCFMVEYDSEFGFTKTYYSDDVKINPESYRGHEIGNWYYKLKEVDGCIMLMNRTEHEDYIEIERAIEVKEFEIDSNQFTIPKNMLEVASVSAVTARAKVGSLSKQQYNCYMSKLNSKKVKEQKEKHTTYIRLVISEKGEILFIEPYNRDEYGYYKIAMDMLENCKIPFAAGEIDSEKVTSETYFSVVFNE